MSNTFGQFEQSSPEGVVKAPQGAIFFRHENRFFLLVDNKVAELLTSKKAFVFSYKTKPWFSYLKEELISFETVSETWVKKGEGNNKKGWEFIENSDPLIQVLSEGIATTPTPTPTPTSSVGAPPASDTPTPTPTATPTPTSSVGAPPPSDTPTPTPTPTISETPTETPTPTISETPTETPTPTISETPTSTPTPTISNTPSITPTNTVTPSPTLDPSSIGINGTSQQVWTTGGTGSLIHTPSSTPNGVLLFATNVNTSNNRIATVRYGGVSMTFVTSSADTAGESLHTQAWFLGSGIPSGAQTASLTYTGAGTDTIVIHVATISNPGNSNTQIQSIGAVPNDAASPQLTLATNGSNCMAFGQIGSGFDATSSLSLLSGMTAINDYDAGAKIVRFDRQTTSSTSNFTIGYSSSLDDVAYVAFNVSTV